MAMDHRCNCCCPEGRTGTAADAGLHHEPDQRRITRYGHLSDLLRLYEPSRNSSRCTESGVNAGRHTAMYSAPSAPGVLYWIHSPLCVMMACPALTSIVPVSDLT